jgi:hypothetical protein
MSVPNLNPPFAAGHAVVERALLRKFAGFTQHFQNEVSQASQLGLNFSAAGTT